MIEQDKKDLKKILKWAGPLLMIIALGILNPRASVITEPEYPEVTREQFVFMCMSEIKAELKANPKMQEEYELYGIGSFSMEPWCQRQYDKEVR
jgi:hypothetical protein